MCFFINHHLKSNFLAFILGTFFGMDPQFWINLQSRYELRLVQYEQAAANRARVIPFMVRHVFAHRVFPPHRR